MAANNRFPREAFMAALRYPEGEIELANDEFQPDSCSSYRTVARRSSTTPLGTFREDQIPKLCADDPSGCEIQYIGLDGAHTSGSLNADFSRASRSFGFEELRSIYPNANLNHSGDCTGVNCANINIQLTSSEAAVQSDIKIPMILLKPFGDKFITLSSNQSRRLEGKLG